MILDDSKYNFHYSVDFNNVRFSEIALSSISLSDVGWKNHKIHSERLQGYYVASDLRRFLRYSERMLSCASFLCFQKSAFDDNLKLIRANFCRVRNCPICQWRRSLKHKSRLLERLPIFEKEYKGYSWLFLTLTVKNCDVTDLKTTIKQMHNAFINNFVKYKLFKAVGWIKTVEVTRSKIGQSHPHFHVLMLMPPSYFQGSNYLKMSDWSNLWKRALSKKGIDLSYQPIVDIRKVKPNLRKGTCSLVSVISEIAKYSSKPSDFYDFDYFIEYSNQVHNMRFVSTGGCLKGILSDNYTNDEMIHVGDNIDSSDLTPILHTFHWVSSMKDYIYSHSINL